MLNGEIQVAGSFDLMPAVDLSACVQSPAVTLNHGDGTTVVEVTVEQETLPTAGPVGGKGTSAGISADDGDRRQWIEASSSHDVSLYSGTRDAAVAKY